MKKAEKNTSSMLRSPERTHEPKCDPLQSGIWKELRKAQATGISQGAKSICGAILNLAESNKEDNEKVDEIKKFCKKAVG